MTGGGGADRFVFQYLPWQAARISDFTPGTDVLDLRILFANSGYKGTDPQADGYLRFEPDGAGGTKVIFDADGPAPQSPWPFLIATLDHIQPSGIHNGDWLFA